MSTFIQQYGAFLFGCLFGGTLTFYVLRAFGQTSFLVVTIGRPGKGFINFEAAVQKDGSVDG